MQIAPYEGVSCAPRSFYAAGGFYEPRYTLARLRDISEPVRKHFAVLGQVVPQAMLKRRLPTRLWAPDQAECDAVLADFAFLDKAFSVSPAALLVKIAQPTLWNDVLCVVLDGTLFPVYETYRNSDLALKGTEIGPRVARLLPVVLDRGQEYVFISSVGAFNYGHWLVDDLPRVLAVADFLRELPNACLLMTAHNHEMDTLRLDFLTELLGSRVQIQFVDQNQRYDFDSIYFVTPVSQHPIIKNPFAIRLVSDLTRDASPPAANGRKIFVNRGAHWPRQIINIEEVREFLVSCGFCEVLPEDMTFNEQRDLFSSASHVCGIMGSAMTNTVFSPASAKILHLAPLGWREPFFWDLSDSLGQKAYATVFGTPLDNGSAVYQQSFKIDLALLAAAITAADFY